jgi:hypothetical protein
VRRSRITLVQLYVSIRLSERVNEFRSIERFRTQDTGHLTTGYEPAHLADLTKSSRFYISNYGIIKIVSEESNRFDTCTDNMMAESTAILIQKFDGMDYKR